MADKPFRVSDDYLDWAHSSGAEDGQPLALRLMAAPIQRDARGDHRLYTDPQLVAEIADVAELYVGGDDNDLRAAGVRSRAIKWLRERGLTVRQALRDAA